MPLYRRLQLVEHKHHVKMQRSHWPSSITDCVQVSYFEMIRRERPSERDRCRGGDPISRQLFHGGLLYSNAHVHLCMRTTTAISKHMWNSVIFHH